MKLHCKECQHELEPKEAGGSVLCSHCQYPFSYSEANMYHNYKKSKRQEAERLKRADQLAQGAKNRR